MCLKFPKEYSPLTYTQDVVLTDPTNQNQFYYVCLPIWKKMPDLKLLAKYLGDDLLTIANPARVKELFGCTVKDLNLFSLMNFHPVKSSVDMIIDRHVAEAPCIAQKPMDNNHTIAVNIWTIERIKIKA